MTPDDVLKAPASVAPRPVSRLGWGVGALALALIAGGGLFARSRLQGSAAPAPSGSAAARPAPVVVASVLEQDVPIYLEGLGNATPLNTVTVRSQVDGRLDRVLFKEGQSVHARDVLAEVDARPFRIQLHQAEAALARDTAQLANARVALSRNEALRAEGLVTQQQLDDQQALVKQQEASLKGDQTQIESARLTLDYAQIRAPIDGVTGVRLIDPGNLLHAADPTGLVVITQLDPMAIVFNLPEDDLVRVNRALARGPLRVEVWNRDGATEVGNGELTVVDNQINSATATARLKAVVPNAERQLWPNQFVKVRLQLETRKAALVVPNSAIQRGPDGTFVYVVSAEGIATPRHVEIAISQDNQTLLKSGLSKGERVVVEGQAQLRPNAKVIAREQPPSGTGHAAEPAGGGKHRGGKQP